MSYLVLARKWRPKTFADTAGQPHVLKALTNALELGRLHHAYLFAGTRGVGKTTIARILAKCLNCEKGVTPEPCGECSACRAIDEGRFVDLIEVDAASKTKVDDTRELLDNVQYRPAAGRYKVYLIDEVHMLSKSSFNALLKTLEEPPPHVVFLLATTEAEKLPVTVLSRCLQFNLKRFTPQVIRERLAYICGEEKIDTDEESLALLARAADGSMRDSLSLLDQAIAYGGGKLEVDSVRAMLGTVERRHVERLLGLLADGDGAGLLAAIAEMDEQFPNYASLLDDLAHKLHRIAVFQVVGASDAGDDLEERDLKDFAGRLSPEDVQLYYQIAVVGRRDLHLAPDPRSGIEMTLLRMLAFRPAAAGQGAAPAGNRAPARPAPGDEAPAASGSATAASATWETPDWPALIETLGLTGADRMLAGNCAFLKRRGNVLELSLDERSESLLTAARRERLAEALSKHYGEKLKIDVTVGAADVETPLQTEARLADERLEAARESLEADPNVRALKDMFGATLNADSIEIVNRGNAGNREH